MHKTGYEKLEGAVATSLIRQLRCISDLTVSLDLGMRKIGLGNRSLRNSTVFTGNLILKHPLFAELLECITPIARKEIGDNCVVSEFKLVSSMQSKNFDMWWHRDFPFSQNLDARFNSKISIGCIVPLCDFSPVNGSTFVLPGSHKTLKSPTSYQNKDFVGEGIQLVSKQGDIWLYDPRLIHSGAQNPSREMRHIVLLQFVVPPINVRENFKYQVERLPYTSKFLQQEKALCNTHVPDINKFGANRGWEHTSYGFIFSAFKRCNIATDRLVRKLKLFIFNLMLKLRGDL